MEGLGRGLGGGERGRRMGKAFVVCREMIVILVIGLRCYGRCKVLRMFM